MSKSDFLLNYGDEDHISHVINDDEARSSLESEHDSSVIPIVRSHGFNASKHVGELINKVGVAEFGSHAGHLLSPHHLDQHEAETKGDEYSHANFLRDVNKHIHYDSNREKPEATPELLGALYKHQLKANVPSDVPYHPNHPDSVVQHMIKEKNWAGVADSVNASPEALRVAHQNLKNSTDIARHSNTPVDVLRDIVKNSPPSNARSHALNHPNFPASERLQHVKDELASTGKSPLPTVFRHNRTAEMIDHVVKHASNASDRMDAIENHAVSNETLHHVMNNDEHSGMRSLAWEKLKERGANV